MRVLAICGSLQAQSANLSLLQVAARKAPDGVEVVLFDGLRHLPLFDPDLEAKGEPGPVRDWRKAIATSDALLIASPEYGHSLPGALKNAIDWVIGSGELERKVVAITAAVPGPERGRLGLKALRDALGAVSAAIVGGEPIARGPDFDAHVAALLRDLVDRVRSTRVFDVGPVRDEQDLRGILELQRRNLVRNLSPRQSLADGFVTVEHTMDVLRRMHAISPSVVAKHGDDLAGYALMMPVECRSFIPILEPMFERLSKLHRDGRPLLERRMYVIGQVCVDAPYRGQGVFDLLYLEHKRQFAPRFEFVITQVATGNARSMGAHQRVGFEPIDHYTDATDDWVVLLWDFGSGREAAPGDRTTRHLTP